MKVSTEALDRFLICPYQYHLYKTSVQSEGIPLLDYYRYVRRGLYISGLKWVMLYRKVTKTKRPRLASFVADYRQRAWRTRPSAVKRRSYEPTATNLMRKLTSETSKILSLLQHRIRGTGDIIGVSRKYTLPDIGVYGSIDAVYQDPHGHLHIYKLTDDLYTTAYRDTTYLDVLGFQQIYGKEPDFLFLIDILTQKKVSLTASPQSGIIKSLTDAVAQLQAGSRYKTPGEHCKTCRFNMICDMRKRGNDGNRKR